MEIIPHWTKSGNWGLGRDPLGMQATSVRLYRNLVPGLTNVTNRLRYYSYYCWVVQLYEQTKHSQNDTEWKIFIRRAEAVYALACFVAEPKSVGLAGGVWANEYRQKISDQIFDLKPHTDKPGEATQYLKATRGNFGQFYIASMTEVGLLAPSIKIPIVSETLGRQMANAFRQSVGDVTELLEETIRTGTILPSKLKIIGEVAHPSNIEIDTEEMTLLRNYLLAENSEDKYGKARRDSAWLVLDLINRGVTDINGFREVFYNRILPDGSEYTICGEIIDRWRAFQANEYCHISLECLLNALLRQLSFYPDGKEPQALIEDLLKSVFDSQMLTLSFEEFAQLAGHKYTKAENNIAEPILNALSNIEQQEDPSAIRAAVNLIAVLWMRWRSSDTTNVRQIIAQYANGGKSLAGVMRLLDVEAQSSMLNVISKVIRQHIIADHLGIAGHKLAGSGKFTYHFTLADGILNDGRIDRYGYTNPRLNNLLQFLQDAQLCDGISITSDGRRFLNEHKPV